MLHKLWNTSTGRHFDDRPKSHVLPFRELPSVRSVVLGRTVNADRRHIGKVCVALLEEGHANEEIHDSSHVALVEAVKHLLSQEFWQLKTQSKHEGKNASTDAQLAICRLALPALELAVAALETDDYAAAMTHIKFAVETDGTVPTKKKGKK